MQGLISFTGKVTVMIYLEEFRKRNKNARQEFASFKLIKSF